METNRRIYPFFQVDAFTSQALSGNPAGVVLDADTLSDVEMQAIAREVNNSETAFVLSADADDHDVRVRFFTPTTEVPSCGHATVAAHYVRALENNLPAGRVVHKIGAGILPVDIERRDGDVRITMTQSDIKFEDELETVHQGAIMQALGVEHTDRDSRCPIQVVSTGHSKVLIGLHELTTLHSIVPDLDAMSALSKEIGCNGYFVFVLAETGPYLAHGRMFAPAIGIAEDPVTGNGNGPLAAYLAYHQLVTPVNGVVAFRAIQGEAMGRPGEVDVTVTVDDEGPRLVTVAGAATIVIRGHIEL